MFEEDRKLKQFIKLTSLYEYILLNSRDALLKSICLIMVSLIPLMIPNIIDKNSS